MRIQRKDNGLNDYIEVLDEKFMEAKRQSKNDTEVVPRALELLTDDENRFIDAEVEKCIHDRRYFMENFYVIRDERGQLRTLYPFFSHQDIISEAVEEEWKEKGCCRLIILKPRQAGSTTWNAAMIFHATIFVPNTYSLVMGQDDRVSDEIYQRIMDANAALPWFLKPEQLSTRAGRQVIFQRSDEHTRTVDPGLGSTLMVSNAQKSTGVAIGRTVRNILASEMSRWPDAQVWTGDIKPSLNAPDMLGIIESTAYGRTGLYYNMWRAAEKGKSIWRALFIPVYKVRKYSLPVYKSENFTLTRDEKLIRRNVKENENFTIPLGFFKWRRAEIIEAVNATGSEETHYESYPLNPLEAFIASGDCAFPKKCLKEQQRINVRDPILIGEIEYAGNDTDPILHLHKPTEDELMDNPKYHNRLWVWDLPDENDAVEYYIGADSSSGTARDFSDGVVYKIGYGMEPTVQVAEWHGLINPSHFAKVLAALGRWYHIAEIAVEYQASGITTGDELRWVLDWPNIYRWKHLDKVSGVSTQHIHWLTTSRTRDDAINRVCEALIDKTIILRNHFLIEEMLDFGREEGYARAEAMSGNDDAVMATCIAICALHQSGKRQEWAESAGIAGQGSRHANLLPSSPHVYAVVDMYGRQIPRPDGSSNFDTEKEAADYIRSIEKQNNVKLAGVWTVKPIVVNRANTIFSPAWDTSGAEHELATVHGMSPREQMMNPSTVQSYRDFMRVRSAMRAGNAGGAGGSVPPEELVGDGDGANVVSSGEDW